MMEAVSISQTSIDFYEATLRSNPGDGNLQCSDISLDLKEKGKFRMSRVYKNTV
jgi:hypothetical protein